MSLWLLCSGRFCSHCTEVVCVIAAHFYLWIVLSCLVCHSLLRPLLLHHLASLSSHQLPRLSRLLYQLLFQQLQTRASCPLISSVFLTAPIRRYGGICCNNLLSVLLLFPWISRYELLVISVSYCCIGTGFVVLVSPHCLFVSGCVYA